MIIEKVYNVNFLVLFLKSIFIHFLSRYVDNLCFINVSPPSVKSSRSVQKLEEKKNL